MARVHCDVSVATSELDGNLLGWNINVIQQFDFILFVICYYCLLLFVTFSYDSKEWWQCLDSVLPDGKLWVNFKWSYYLFLD